MSDESSATPRRGIPRRKSTKRQQTTDPMSDENSTPATDDNVAAKDNLAGAKAHAKQAAEDLRAAAEAKARELKTAAEAKAREFRDTASAKAGEYREKAEHFYGDARAKARTWQDEGEVFIREKPLKAVVCALVAGFVLGALFRNK